MQTTDPNRAALIKVAEHLGPRLDDFLFLGGATVGLLLTDPASRFPRPTKDVDVVVEVATFAEYSQGLRAFLLERRFRECQEADSPLCAWEIEGVRVDVMPARESILGFGNRWFGVAFEDPEIIDLEGHRVRHANAPCFLATKLEAFEDRGGGDYYGSDDLEDV